MKKTNYPIQTYKPYSVNNSDNDSEHEKIIVPGKALLSAASREVIAPNFKDYMLERMSKTAANNIANTMLEPVDHREFNKSKTMSFKLFYAKLLILHGIHNIKCILQRRKHVRSVKIRPAGSMMTINEAMKRSAKLKTLKDFGDWIYDNWAKWDKGFNWHMIKEIDKAESINLVTTDRNNSDSLIIKIADDIADDINKNAK